MNKVNKCRNHTSPHTVSAQPFLFGSNYSSAVIFVTYTTLIQSQQKIDVVEILTYLSPVIGKHRLFLAFFK